MTTTPAPESASTNRLEHFHITFFAIVMGFSGLTLAVRAAEHASGATGAISTILAYVTLGLFGLITLIYGLKAARYPAAVSGEWHHPVKIAFFPAVSISLLLLAAILLPMSKAAAAGFWWVGMILQGGMTLAVVSAWIGTRAFQHGVLTPAWFIPAVGNVVVPVAGIALGQEDISWLFFSAGILFWIVLLTLVINRLIFHDPIPGKLQPTLVILIAPPAVGFVSWFLMVGEVDHFGRILLNMGYVFTAIVLTQLPKLVKLPFAMSFWALSFPFAAITIASFRFAHGAEAPEFAVLGWALLALLLVIVGVLTLKTLGAISKNGICQPD